MDDIDSLRIVPIARLHDRKKFNCKAKQLTVYLKQHARQNDERNIAKAFVAVDDNNVVYGYYTLSNSDIEFAELPEEITRRLPRYPVPAALIGKLAVDITIEGKGLGKKLLIDALQRIYSISNETAIKVILVDAIDTAAKKYYLKFGFIEIPGYNLKLFLPIETVEKLFN